MHKSLLAAGLAGLILATPAQSATVMDAVGDFLPSYAGPQEAFLDVTSFSVNYNSLTSSFILSATMAGPIELDLDAIYVIGANTGTGPIAPFGPLGQPNVRFNQVIVINTDGTGNVGATPLNPAGITIAGNVFSAIVPLALLPSTGYAPLDYGFNLWPRYENAITDFSPENALLAAVPEPASWAMMIAGFAMAGTALRQRRRKVPLSYA